jgi:hypothetical protein
MRDRDHGRHEFDGQRVGHSDGLAGHDVRQVLCTVLGPLAVLLNLQIKYLLVQTWACKSAWSPVALHAVALLMLLVSLGAGLLALREWRGAGKVGASEGHAPLSRWDPGDLGGREGRTRVNAAMGLGLSAMSAVIIVAMWLPHFVLGPCQQ